MPQESQHHPTDSYNFANYIYEYNGNEIYHPKQVNIGDYIQSLAARAFLPKVDFFIDRDNLSLLPPHSKKNTKIIANGWYCFDDRYHIFDGSIEPLLTSIHIHSADFFKRQTAVIDQLKRESEKRPIGCRDYHTLRLLESVGVKGFFSGCLTTTLDRSFFTTEQNRHGLILCDIPEAFTKRKKIKFYPAKKLLRGISDKLHNRSYWINDFVCSAIDSFGTDVSYTNHLYPMTLTHEERFALAKSLLKQYAEAKLVITSRIHCALPCLALETPVVLIAKNDPYRYEGLKEFLNHMLIDENGKVVTSIKKDGNGNIINPDAFKPYAEKLRQAGKAFISGD